MALITSIISSSCSDSLTRLPLQTNKFNLYDQQQSSIMYFRIITAANTFHYLVQAPVLEQTCRFRHIVQLLLEIGLEAEYTCFIY